MVATNLWLGLSLFSLFSYAQESTADIEASFMELPVCGINCILPLLEEIECSLSNLTSLSSCLCLNIQAESKVAKCVVTNCNYTELVKIEKAQYELCYGEPEPSRQSSILAVTVVLACLVIIFVALRCWSRYTISKEFWWDDWILLLATMMFLWMQALNIWGVKIGFGVHVWNVDPDNNVKLYQYEWIYEILYAVTTVTIKTSILLLYYRIFPQDWLRKTVSLGCVYMVIHGLIFFFVIIFQCKPFSLVYDKSLEGSCLDIHAVVFAGSILSMLEDIATISLPIPSILKLRLPLKKKVQVVLMMCVGLIAVIASMIRMKFAVNFYYSIDINWDDYGIAILSMIELGLSIICVCFPAVKLLFSQHFPSRPAAPPTMSRLQSLQLTASHASSNSQSNGLLQAVRRKLSSLFTRSQTSIPDLDEERPAMGETTRVRSKSAGIPSPGLQVNSFYT